MLSRARCAFPAACIMALATGCGPVGNSPLTTAERFQAHALTFDNGEPMPRLQRWEDEIRVTILGDTSYTGAVEQHMRDVGEATGLPWRISGYDGNMIVTFGTRRQVQAYLREFDVARDRLDSICFVIPYLDDNGRILLARAYIRTDLSEEFIGTCIAQEMTQPLGLPGDLEERSDTTFSSTGVPRLTAHDKTILRILYDPRLYNGMPREEVLAALPEIIADLEEPTTASR